MPPSSAVWSISRRPLLLGLATIGLFASIYHPVGIAWLVKSAAKRGRALGVNGVFGAIGVASAGLVAGSLIDLFSWRAAFIVPGVICLATGIALWIAIARGLVAEGEGDTVAHSPSGRSELLRVLLVLVLTMTVMGLLFQATQAALPKVFDLRLLRDLVGEGAFGVGRRGGGGLHRRRRHADPGAAIWPTSCR